jgi:mRNA interferase RelE/StbE
MAGRFTVHLTPTFRKDLERLPGKVQEAVLQAVRLLERNPTGPDSHIKKLKGAGIGRWRLRVGHYRVRYDVLRQDVVLYRVRHRRDVYRES